MRFVVMSCVLACSTAWAFESGRASFSVRVNDEVIPYTVFAVFVLANEMLELEVLSPESGEFVLSAGTALRSTDPRTWLWAAPQEPGAYELDVIGAIDSIRLNVLVMRPAFELANGYLGEYRVGQYPSKPLNGDPVYLPPDGFVELDESTASVPVSPHFRLSQFASKQAGGYPKYLVLRERLLLKLELLLEQVNVGGIATETFTIMSGFRTPFYNAAIGNVPHSRHVYGGAADIYIDDHPRDGVMDDINGDGNLDYRDAQTLYKIADRLFRDESNRRLIGGLGIYRSTSAHGPFLHVDARGTRSRWGLLP